MLPAATEIAAALGLVPQLVGVSHECDHPPEVASLPQVTHCEIHGGALPSGGIDTWVSETLTATGTLYTMDEPLLRRLRPDVILTQRLCDVCAVGYDSVTGFAATLPGPPVVVNLEPASVADIFDDIRRVAAAARVPERAEAVIAELQARVDAVRARAAGAARRPRTVILEWIDPPFASGHWNPEVVEMAGGVEPLGAKGRPSRRVSWDDVIAARPEVLIVACCGFDLDRTRRDLPLLFGQPGWSDLPAVHDGQVHAVDGSQYFARPGPRVVDTLEIVAEILHPDLFRGMFPARPVVRVEAQAVEGGRR
jgi:iron complex transport system substrate-binding protein